MAEAQSQPKPAARWSQQQSHFFLETLVTLHKCGKGGDNGLRLAQFAEIANAVNAKFQAAYGPEQIKNHYRVWRMRVKAPMDLIKCSGLGWNGENSKFDGPDHMWASFRKTEERFWKDITVQPIHYEVLQWLGNEIATGQDAAHPADIGFDDIDLVDMTLGEDDGEESAHRTTPRGRPASKAPRSTP